MEKADSSMEMERNERRKEFREGIRANPRMPMVVYPCNVYNVARFVLLHGRYAVSRCSPGSAFSKFTCDYACGHS
jgi:hypothetical protein